ANLLLNSEGKGTDQWWVGYDPARMWNGQFVAGTVDGKPSFQTYFNGNGDDLMSMGQGPFLGVKPGQRLAVQGSLLASG
ncbi:hypothetical protein, partial [Escherichia coli]